MNPSSPPARTTSNHARHLSRTIVILVVSSLTVAATLSLLLVDVWRQDRASALGYIAVDLAFGLSLSVLIVWLTRRTVSQMELTERALRQSEERSQRIINHSLDLICEIDTQGILIFANPAYRTILGYEPEHLVGQALTAYLHPAYTTAAQQAWQQAVPAGQARPRLELRMRHADGHYLWFESSRQFVLDAQQQVSSVVLINRDITSRKQTEDTLARYARSMHALYETSLEINALPDVATLLNAIVQRATDLLDAKMGGLYLLNQEDDSLVLVTSVPVEHAGTVLQVGQGLAGRVAQSGLPLFISDYSSWPERATVYNHVQLGRTLAVPLKLRGSIIGVLNVEDADPGIFSEEDIRLAGLFADQAAIAIENRRLYEQTQSELLVRRRAEEALARARHNLERSNQQLTQILEVGNLLRSHLRLDALLHEIVKGAQQSLGYNMVVLNLLNESTQQMVVHSYAGLDTAGQQALAGGTYDWEEERRLLRPEFRLGRAYFIPHGTLDWKDDLRGPVYRPNLPVSDQPDAWHPEDVLFIPIELRGGRIAGTIYLDAPHDGLRPTIESLRPLEIFVNQAAIAIENARLFEAERQRRRELEAVYSASRQLTQSLELAAVLDAILNSVMQLVPATNAQLFLYDGQHLKFGSGLAEHGQKMTWPSLEPRPEGLTYTVAHTGQAIFIEDTSHHPIFNAASILPSPLLAVAGLPLKMEDTMLGVMNVCYALPHPFSESERSILTLLAAQASIALHNARLHRQVQSYAAELEQRVAARTAELDRERRHLQAILDSAGEGIQIMDPDGRIVYVNPATETITGYTSSEMIGKTTRLWHDSINPAAKVDDLREQVRQGKSWQGEIINRRKDGTPYDAAITITPLNDAQQQVTGFVVMHRDITRLKELEHLKDQFVSRIGHELRTPMANIKLYAQLLERGKPERQPEYLQTLHREIERLTHLNDSFLEMAELDATRTAPSLSPVNANQLAEDLLRNLEPRAAQRQLLLRRHFDRHLPETRLLTDRAMLARALGNILENALHYAPENSTITVATNRLTADGDYACAITVHNTGPGISSAELPHMFERFYRGEAARDYKVPGAGLGLAIAYTIMQRLSGRLTVDSLPGQGVTFTLWLR